MHSRDFGSMEQAKSGTMLLSNRPWQKKGSRRKRSLRERESLTKIRASHHRGSPIDWSFHEKYIELSDVIGRDNH
jgi:hypothetical protein